MDCLKKLPPTIVTTGEFDHLRRDALMIIPKLQQAGRLLDVLDNLDTKHSYESEPETAASLLAEFETVRIWNRVVLGQEPNVLPCQSKNLFANKYKYQG